MSCPSSNRGVVGVARMRPCTPTIADNTAAKQSRLPHSFPLFRRLSFQPELLADISSATCALFIAGACPIIFPVRRVLLALQRVACISFADVFIDKTNPHVSNLIRTFVAKTGHAIAALTQPTLFPMSARFPQTNPFIKRHQKRHAPPFRVTARFHVSIMGDIAQYVPPEMGAVTTFGTFWIGIHCPLLRT